MDKRTIKMPGKFDCYFNGSAVGQGLYEQYANPGPVREAARRLAEAYAKRRHVFRGKGETVIIAADEEALEILWQYADWCIDTNLYGDRDHAEMAAAAKVMERIRPGSARRW